MRNYVASDDQRRSVTILPLFRLVFECWSASSLPVVPHRLLHDIFTPKGEGEQQKVSLCTTICDYLCTAIFDDLSTTIVICDVNHLYKAQ